MTTPTAADIVRDTLHIMSQGASAQQRVVDAYMAKRNRERDINWVVIQAAREYGATNMYADRARLALGTGIGVREADRFAVIMKEELDHYRAYMNLLDLTLGKGTEPPDSEAFHYLNVEFTAQGAGFHGDSGAIVARKWPEHHRFITLWMKIYNELPRWTSRLLMTQGEGGSVGWHWCMSNLPGNDEFLRLAAKLEKTVVEDEIFHGPEEIKELAASFDPANALPWDETLNLAREMRYLDVRERNEQFQYPLTEAELEDIRRA
ncbi:hypothetical protein, partial [Immundisolibacter sp.]|uniref:hypothetical protein n=1 Tax=Immundisolibacter sp. TaxID=1934948 RepID=UPI00261099DE